jgi:microcystin degradation protein MlrC
MRIAVAGFMHESNTFSPLLTDRAAFAAQSLTFGPSLLEEWREAHHEVAGYLDALGAEGVEPVPLVMAWATPGGPVTDDVYEEVTNAIIDGLRRERPEGLLLALHGAMVTASHLDADGETAFRIRRAMGADFPVAITLDLHGNVSERLVESSDIVLSYRTNPHVDQRRMGKLAGNYLIETIRGQLRPRMALAKPPVIVNIMVQDSSEGPFRALLDRAESMMAEPDVRAVSFLPGFPYADVPQMGPSIIVLTHDNPDRARTFADQLGGEVWEAREELTRPLPDPATAVARALQSSKRPVVLVDTGDNVGGGSAADGTIILAELLRQGATESVVCLYAPEEVKRCAAAGIGAEVSLKVGGKVDRLHGDPVEVSGCVKVLHDGTYVETAVRHGGKRVNRMGLSALVELPGRNLLLLTTQRHPPFSLGQLTCVGIDPRLQRILVVKAAIAYKAAYKPVAGEIIEVDTPGFTAVNPHRFNYRHVGPMYPLS